MSKGVVFLVIVFGAVLLTAAASLPFGDWENREVSMHYLENGSHSTGSANIVNSIVWDFRGYDTMGEEIVLFTAAVGVVLVVRREFHGRHSQKH